MIRERAGGLPHLQAPRHRRQAAYNGVRLVQHAIRVTLGSGALHAMMMMVLLVATRDVPCRAPFEARGGRVWGGDLVNACTASMRRGL